jgi:hypothetical protein
VDSTKDIELLMNEGIKFAGKMLEEYGEFLPYGFVMDLKGEVRPLSAVDGAEPPPPGEVIDSLNTSFRLGADSKIYRAVGLFVNVKVTPSNGAETDAVQVGLEHRDGRSMNVYFPYQRTVSGTVELGELFAEPRVPVIF